MFAHQLRAGVVGLGQQRDELVGVDAEEPVGRAERLQHALQHLLEPLVGAVAAQREADRRVVVEAEQ